MTIYAIRPLVAASGPALPCPVIVTGHVKAGGYMSRKDYELIAAVIAAYPNREAKLVALRLADAFVLDNPRFDRVKFLKACGV